MSNNDFYNDGDEGSDEFSGFSIVDESGIEVERLKKLLHKAIKEEDEETIATPVPENELTVMLDNAAVILPKEGQKLNFEFCGDYETDEKQSGKVFLDGKKLGDFKTPFVKRLFSTRKGQFCAAYMLSENPLMIKLVFSETEKEGFEKLD